MVILDSNENQQDIPRSQKPHLAIITMRIDVRSIESDGSLGNTKLGFQDLSKYGMSTKAQLSVTGIDEADCIAKTKELLERLNNG
tara:strand:+ start:2126 stop:2380 length:255 start_codon:yes stop_codon:yes gene_type:complete